MSWMLALGLLSACRAGLPDESENKARVAALPSALADAKVAVTSHRREEFIESLSFFASRQGFRLQVRLRDEPRSAAPARSSSTIRYTSIILVRGDASITSNNRGQSDMFGLIVSGMGAPDDDIDVIRSVTAALKAHLRGDGFELSGPWEEHFPDQGWFG